MDVSHMREFVAFSRFMNFSRAARALHISQPTLSNHIAAIEAEVGAVLVERGNPLRLTQSGRVFLEGISAVIDAYDQVLSQARTTATMEMPLTIASSSDSNCSGCTFSKSVNEFLSHHRNVFFSQVSTTTGSAFDELAQGNLDAVMVCVAPQRLDLERGVAFQRIKPAFPNRLGVWMDCSHPLANLETIHWEDLNGGKFPMGINVELWAAGVIQLLRDHGVSFDTSVVSQPGASFLTAYESDELIIMEETLISLPFLSAPHHCFRLLDEPDALAETYIAYLPERVSPALRLYLGFLENDQV